MAHLPPCDHCVCKSSGCVQCCACGAILPGAWRDPLGRIVRGRVDPSPNLKIVDPSDAIGDELLLQRMRASEAVEKELHRALRILGIPTSEHEERLRAEGRCYVTAPAGSDETYYLGKEPLVRVCRTMTLNSVARVDVINVAAEKLATQFRIRKGR